MVNAERYFLKDTKPSLWFWANQLQEENKD